MKRAHSEEHFSRGISVSRCTGSWPLAYHAVCPAGTRAGGVAKSWGEERAFLEPSDYWPLTVGGGLVMGKRLHQFC